MAPGEARIERTAATQEDFLVLSSECILIVEDEERHLKAYVSAPEETDTPRATCGDWNTEYTTVRASWPL